MNRREFLLKSSALAATTLLAPALPSRAGTLKSFGVQLYSFRDELPKDPVGILKQIAGMGYSQWEGYAGPKGIYWGMKPKEFRAFAKDLGATMVSSHCDTRNNFQQTIDDAAEVGLKYLLTPYIGPQKSLDEWKLRADSFNKMGEMCAKSGLKFGYHNHDYSFKTQDGQIPQEVLLANTDPKFVVFELDLCWIEAAGLSAVDHLKKYRGRYELCHIKDFKRQPKFVQVDVGTGDLDYKKILRGAMDNGVKYFLVEQEQYPVSVMGSLKSDAEYMKKLEF